MTGAHRDLVAAWDKEGGPMTACRLMRRAIDLALDKEYPDFSPLVAILPYIARRMPENIEIQIDPLAHLSDEELAARLLGARVATLLPSSENGS